VIVPATAVAVEHVFEAEVVAHENLPLKPGLDQRHDGFHALPVRCEGPRGEVRLARLHGELLAEVVELDIHPALQKRTQLAKVKAYIYMTNDRLRRVHSALFQEVHYLECTATPRVGMNLRGRSGLLMGQGRRLQALYLLWMNRVAGTDLANDSGADVGAVNALREVADDLRGDLLDALVGEVRRMSGGEVVTAPGQDVEAAALGDLSEPLGVSSGADRGAVHNGATAQVAETGEFVHG